MNTLEGLPILEHYNQLLATGNEQHAWAIVQEVFNCFGKKGPKQCAWYTLVAALGNNSAEIDAEHRSSMIFFYEYSAALFSAVYVLHKNRRAAKPGKKRLREKGEKERL